MTQVNKEQLILCDGELHKLAKDARTDFYTISNKLEKVDDLEILTISETPESKVDWKKAKIPWDLWQQILNFFHWSQEKYKSEALVHLYYSVSEDTWAAMAPPQCGFGLTVKEDESREDERATMRAKLPGYTEYGSVHHHCTSSAFQSGVDEEDENDRPGFHITIGYLDKPKYDWHARFIANPGDENIDFLPSDIIACDIERETGLIHISDCGKQNLINDYALIRKEDETFATPEEWKDAYKHKSSIQKTLPSTLKNNVYGDEDYGDWFYGNNYGNYGNYNRYNRYNRYNSDMGELEAEIAEEKPVTPIAISAGDGLSTSYIEDNMEYLSKHPKEAKEALMAFFDDHIIYDKDLITWSFVSDLHKLLKRGPELALFATVFSEQFGDSLDLNGFMRSAKRGILLSVKNK